MQGCLEQHSAYFIVGLTILSFPHMDVRSNIICDNKHMLIGLSDGSLYTISWKGEVCAFGAQYFLYFFPTELNIFIMTDNLKFPGFF